MKRYMENNFAIRMVNHKVISKETYFKEFAVNGTLKNIVVTYVRGNDYKIVFRGEVGKYVFVEGDFDNGATIKFGKTKKHAKDIDDIRVKLLSVKQLEKYNINDIWDNIKPTREFDFSIIEEAKSASENVLDRGGILMF